MEGYCILGAIALIAIVVALYHIYKSASTEYKRNTIRQQIAHIVSKYDTNISQLYSEDTQCHGALIKYTIKFVNKEYIIFYCSTKKFIKVEGDEIHISKFDIEKIDAYLAEHSTVGQVIDFKLRKQTK